MSTRHKHPEGRFVLRADSIRPYSLGGEAAAIQRTARLRGVREAKSLPYMASAILQPSQILKRQPRPPPSLGANRFRLAQGCSAIKCKKNMKPLKKITSYATLLGTLNF